MEKKLKSWQGWLLFGGTMAIVFVLGLLVSALMDRQAEIVSVFNNKKVEIKGIEPRNEVFGENYPREYTTWTETIKTDFKSEFNGNEAVDVLASAPRNGDLMGRICLLQGLFYPSRAYARYRRYAPHPSRGQPYDSRGRTATRHVLDV